LGPTTNFQGSYKFLYVRTGRRITRKQFKELPMPASAIKAVEALAVRDTQDGNLEFTDHHGNSFADQQYESDANQPTDGAAGVDEGLENKHEDALEDQQERNDGEDEASRIHLEIPGVMEEAGIPGVPEETPGVAVEIPGVYKAEDLAGADPVQEEAGEHTVMEHDPGDSEPTEATAPSNEEDSNKSDGKPPMDDDNEDEGPSPLVS
jgi:hypothetical protein